MESNARGTPPPNGERTRTGWLDAVWEQVPVRCRPALKLETRFNVGYGAYIALYPLSSVALKTVLDGTETHLAVLAAAFGGTSLLSPAISYLAQWIRMRSLVVYPASLIGTLLFLTALPQLGTDAFTALIVLTLIINVAPRVAEMNMFRAVYPPLKRGTAVGWLKAVAATSGLAITWIGFGWFELWPAGYSGLYCLVGALMVFAAFSYARIPVRRRDVFHRDESRPPWSMFAQAIGVLARDGRFLQYQFGTAVAGLANHLAVAFVAEVLKEDLHAGSEVIGLCVAILPAVLVTASSPMWGPFLDRVNPMVGRFAINMMAGLGFACYALGSDFNQVWLFVVGASIWSIGNGGGVINWLTGSQYFARDAHIALYTSVHVTLTGIRGLLAPLLGLWLFSNSGLGLRSGIFWLAAAFSLLGGLMMLWQGLRDPGPVEGTEHGRMEP